MRNNKPIGVFDSGIGGMTVLSKLAEVFPCEDFIYVGDTLNCPYGVKKSRRDCRFSYQSRSLLIVTRCKGHCDCL